MPSAPSRSASSAARHAASSRVAFTRVDPPHLRLADRVIVDVEDLDRVLGFLAVSVDPDDHVLAAIDARRAGGGGFLDHRLGPAGRDRIGHAALGIDALDDLPGFVDQALRQALDIIAAAQRIDDLGHPGLFLDDDLRVAGDPRGEVGRQRDRLVERVGVERLRPAQHRRHRLDRGADDVVVGVGSCNDTPLVWQCVRSILERSSFAPSSVITRCHSVRAARSFATSMKKFMPIAKKNDSRPANASMSSPDAIAAFTYSLPSAIVKASSCTCVAPASCM